MIAPYHTVEDNDQFLSNIANWLAIDERRRDDLEDFPYLFGRPVDLVPKTGLKRHIRDEVLGSSRVLYAA